MRQKRKLKRLPNVTPKPKSKVSVPPKPIRASTPPRIEKQFLTEAAVRDLPLYNRNEAPDIHLQGPNTKGTEYYIAGQVQRQPRGGTYAAERRIGYKAMRRAGVSEEQARREIERVDQYFSSIGVTPDTVIRIPGNRRR